MSESVTRRGFIGSALGATMLPALSPSLLASSPRRGAEKTMLILGGTQFLGPQIVRAARGAGYTITLFNRGKSNPHLFPELEKIRGDRDLDQLEGLAGRHWDVVVDTSGYVPGHVEKAAELLGPNIAQYIFISTLSVYSEDAVSPIDETAPVTVLDDSTLESVKAIRESFPHYSGMKAHCEKAAEAAAPGKVLSLRPGLIVGQGDASDRFTHWPVRVARGGQVLAPGDPDAGTQFIDVRDLGEWIVRCADERRLGTYNAVGFEGPVTMRELLLGAKIVIGSNCTFTWIDDDFLLEQGVRPWSEVPLWVPAAMKRTYVNRKAIEAGLTFRPVGDTIADALRWHRETRGDDYPWRTLAPEKEAKVLAAWRARGGAATES